MRVVVHNHLGSRKTRDASFVPGDQVYDKADPRHIGTVKQVNHTNSGSFALIEWNDSGWLSMKVPMVNLRKAEKEPVGNENKLMRSKLHDHDHDSCGASCECNDCKDHNRLPLKFRDSLRSVDAVTAMVDGRAVKVGDWVGFKSDIEQSGRIVAIKPGNGYGGPDLVLENPSGFSGDYIGGMKRTEVRASDCWL